MGKNQISFSLNLAATVCLTYVLEVSITSVHDMRLEIDPALVVYTKSDHRPYCFDGGGGGWFIHVVLLVVHRVEVVIFFVIKAL